jgi:hypothetical protein
VPATTDDLRRILDDAYDDSVSEAVTLREKLRYNERAIGALISAGSISSVSKNSASQTIAYGAGNLTTAEVARAWRVLIDCHDAVAADASKNTDLLIKSEMMRRLTAVREFTKDFTGLCTA